MRHARLRGAGNHRAQLEQAHRTGMRYLLSRSHLPHPPHQEGSLRGHQIRISLQEEQRNEDQLRRRKILLPQPAGTRVTQENAGCQSQSEDNCR